MQTYEQRNRQTGVRITQAERDPGRQAHTQTGEKDRKTWTQTDRQTNNHTDRKTYREYTGVRPGKKNIQTQTYIQGNCQAKRHCDNPRDRHAEKIPTGKERDIRECKRQRTRQSYTQNGRQIQR